MAEPPSRLGPLRSAPAVWVLLAFAAASVAIAAMPLHTSMRMGAVLAAAAVALVGIIILDRRRGVRLRRLETRIKELLRLDAGPDRPLSEPSAAAPPPRQVGEFHRIEGLLEEVRGRLSQQLKELAKRTSNLEALIDALDEPVLAMDNHDRVLLCNRAAEALLSGPGRRLIGEPLAGLFTAGDVLEMHASARQGQARRGRIRLTTNLGSRVYQVSAAPVPAAWGQGIFGSVLLLRDVTELDRAVQVKSDFVANASHELRTPVSAIRGAVETLLEGARDDPGMSERLLAMIASHAERLEEMIRDLLDLSRLESEEVELHPAPADPSAIELSLRSIFEPAARERRLQLVFELDQGLQGAVTDNALLMLVLRNLLQNALKFAYQETRVLVRGRRVAPARARFEVVDRGIGVPLHLRERIFERYFQADPARTGAGGRRGTGLGLSIVKHAVKALGGEVGIDSVYREGTTVWFEIPLQSEEIAK